MWFCFLLGRALDAFLAPVFTELALPTQAAIRTAFSDACETPLPKTTSVQKEGQKLVRGPEHLLGSLSMLVFLNPPRHQTATPDFDLAIHVAACGIYTGDAHNRDARKNSRAVLRPSLVRVEPCPQRSLASYSFHW